MFKQLRVKTKDVGNDDYLEDRDRGQGAAKDLENSDNASDTEATKCC